MKFVWIAVGIAAMSVAAGVVACQGSDPDGHPMEGGPRAMPVEASGVQVRTLPLEVGAVGSLQANESVVIRSEIAGRVSEISFSEGQKIAQDSILVVIEPSEYRAQVEQIQATVELIQFNFERARQLHQEKLISQQAFDEIQARLKESQANLALAQARLKKTTIRAPFRGILGLRQVSPGDYLQPGQAIVNLEDMDSLKMDFHIPEIYFSQVKTGQTVDIRVDAFPDRTFSGKIYAMDPRIEEATRTLLLRARIPNVGGELRPGMFARVALMMGKHPDAVLIPEQAVVPLGDAKFVYRIVDGKAALAKVTIGRRLEGLVEIIEGLDATDTVVTEGQTKLFEGAPVMVITPTAAKPELPAAAKP